MLGLGPLDWLKLAAGAVAGAALGFLAGEVKGDRAGYARAQAENVQAVFDQAKERQETDDQVSTMADADLCALLGGVWREGRCQ